MNWREVGVSVVLDTEPLASLWAGSFVRTGRGEKLAFPFDGPLVSTACRNCVQTLIKQLVCCSARPILGSSFSSSNSCQGPNSLELA